MSAADDPRQRCRDALLASGYGTRDAHEVLGFDPDGVLDSRSIAVGRHRCASSGPLGEALRLFLLGDTVSTGKPTIASLPLADWVQAGLVDAGSGVARGIWQLSVLDGLVFASDWTLGTGFAPDHVPRVSQAARVLAAATVRRPGRIALDVGTGCGVHALLAARHNDEVVATDVNARALGVCTRNQELNGVPRVHTRKSDGFASIGDDERFDLVLALPPYLVGPPSDVAFLRADARDLCEEIVLQGVDHLEPDGWLQLVVVWPVFEGDRDVEQPPWFDAIDADALLLRWPPVAIEMDAASWLKAEGCAGGEFTERFAAWMAWARQHDVVASRAALLSAHRGSGVHVHLVDEAPARVGTGAGRDIERRLALEIELLHTSVADTRVRLRPDVRWTTSGAALRGLTATTVTLQRTGGLEYSEVTDIRLLASLLERPGADCGAVIGAITGSGASSEAASHLLDALRRLVERGLVETV